MIVISDALALSAPPGVDLNAPVVGWKNVLTATNVFADSALVDSPVTNLANPSTFLKWRSSTSLIQDVSVVLSPPTSVEYLAIAGHNFGSVQISARVEGAQSIDTQQKVLLHFNGVDASTTFPDSAAGASPSPAVHTWTAAGNAQIDTADFQFNGSSGLFDGTGDFISTPDSVDTEPGTQDFTVDFWCRALDNGVQRSLFGKATAFTDATTRSYFMYRDPASNRLNAEVSNGAVTTTITTTTALTVAAGWKHVALVRSGNSLMVFVGGVLESTVAFTGSVNDLNSVFAISSIGAGLLAAWNGWIDEFRLSIGVARWTTTFTPPTAPYQSDRFTKILMHFDGADAATGFFDSSNRFFFPFSNAQVDTAQSKFGGASLLLDGVDDAVICNTHTDFNLGTSDFTIDAWFNCTAVGGTAKSIAGQTDPGFTAASSWALRRETTNNIRFLMAGGVILTGTTLFTNLINPGWHHVAVTRSGTNFFLFIDGILESTGTNAGAFTVSAYPLCIGDRAVTADPWQGWIDEFRMVVGRAAWTANFAPEAFEYDSFFWQPLGDEQLPADDQPIIWRFPLTTLVGVRLRMDSVGAGIPEIAVMYVGELLEFQRRIYVGYRPLPYNLRSNVVTGFSDDATFLGRIVLGEIKESSLSLMNITAAFYRSDMDPWLKSAVSRPFFFAWRPTSYPLEVGFCWLTSDSQMTNQRANGMVQVAASLRGVT